MAGKKRDKGKNLMKTVNKNKKKLYKILKQWISNWYDANLKNVYAEAHLS